MTGSKIILFCVLTACLLSVLHVWTIELTNVDWRICFDNWGNPEPLIRVSAMSFQEQVHVVFNESIFGKVFAFVFLMLPYLPIFFGLVYSKGQKRFWSLIIIFLILSSLSLLSLLTLDEPSLKHSCDRKGTNSGFTLVFLMPALFLVTCAVTLAIGFRKNASERDAK